MRYAGPRDDRYGRMPPMPDLREGRCASHPHPDWWTGSRDQRLAARLVCMRCPLLAACAEWSLSLPCSDIAVWGGMSVAERIERKRARRSATAAG